MLNLEEVVSILTYLKLLLQLHLSIFPNRQVLLVKHVFLFSESLSPLRNRLLNIVPLPSRPSTDNFARPLTRIVDDKTNTIEITPKILTPNINKKKLSKQLQEVFPNVNEVIKEDSSLKRKLTI